MPDTVTPAAPGPRTDAIDGGSKPDLDEQAATKIAENDPYKAKLGSGDDEAAEGAE